jgi:glycosidase
LLLIAEASARDTFYTEHGFDAAYDWTDALGHWAWENVFNGAAPIGEAMVDVLTDGGRGYHPNALVMRFLNNNDTGPRFVTTYGPDFYRVALAMLLTLPGLPCLFTGDEVGAEFHPYETSSPIDWSDRHGLRPEAKKLIHLRQQHLALYSLDWLPLRAEPATPLFAYLRTAVNGQAVVVVLNFSDTAVEATVELPVEAAKLLAANPTTDLWSGEVFPAHEDGRLRLPLPASGFRFLSNGARHV